MKPFPMLDLWLRRGSKCEYIIIEGNNNNRKKNEAKMMDSEVKYERGQRREAWTWISEYI